MSHIKASREDVCDVCGSYVGWRVLVVEGCPYCHVRRTALWSFQQRAGVFGNGHMHIGGGMGAYGQCPECGEHGVERTNGCVYCRICGWGKCSV